MNEQNDFALVRRPPSAVEKAEPGARRILSGMVADTLAVARKEQIAPAVAKFRIGDYEWREPDYRQILIWSNAVGLKPEEVVARLFNPESLKVDDDGKQTSLFPFFDEPLFANSRLLKVSWDLRRLRCDSIEWVEGLEITHVRFIGAPDVRCLSDIGALPLQKLVWLSCCWQGLTAINLASVPQLREFTCECNQLENLVLDSVPELTHLNCDDNEIESLDFRSTPKLTGLSCEGNHLTTLDLSGLRQLEYGLCGGNELTELSLRNLPTLDALDCYANQIRTLDLSQVPELEQLDCHANEIWKLDLSHCPKLWSLDCADNQIAELNVSCCGNLRSLDCSKNRIATLDIRDLEHLETLIYDDKTTKLLKRSDQEF